MTAAINSNVLKFGAQHVQARNRLLYVQSDGKGKLSSSIYRPETGHKYVDRILGKISSLSYSAGTYRISPYIMARMIHPEAKTMSIINHKWTVVFHIEQSNVIVDRIIPSSLIII